MTDNKTQTRDKILQAILMTIILAIVITMGYGLYRYYTLKQDNLIEKHLNNYKDSIKVQEELRKKEKDSLFLLIADRDLEIDILTKKNNSIESKIKDIENTKVKIPENKSEYFNNRYQTDKNTEQKDGGVNLVKLSAEKVIVELGQKDLLSMILPLKDTIILNKDMEIAMLNDNNKDLKTMMTTAEDEIRIRAEYQNAAEANIEELKRQNKKLIKNKKINNILLPVAIVASATVGYAIAK